MEVVVEKGGSLGEMTEAIAKTDLSPTLGSSFQLDVLVHLPSFITCLWITLFCKLRAFILPVGIPITLLQALVPCATPFCNVVVAFVLRISL